MSRASFASSNGAPGKLSRTSTILTDQDTASNYPDTETSHVVSTQYTLSEAIHARRADFCREHSIRIKVGTWNVAGKKGTENDIADWFIRSKGVSENLTGLAAADQDGADQTQSIQDQERDHQQRKANADSTLPTNDASCLPANEEIGLYVLGLQEMVDISSASEALRPYTDPTTANKWKQKLEEALPSGYQLVAEQQLIGLMLFVYASPLVMAHVSSVSTKPCGTGLMGYMGNKGAVVTRVVLGETTRLAFVNCHLSSGLGKAEVDRRNWDAQQILNRVKFDPIVDSLGTVAGSEEKIGDEDFCFWFGDLNYRLTGIPGDDVRRLLTLHTRNEYDLDAARASADDAAKTSVESKRRSTASSVASPRSSMSSAATPSSPSSSKQTTPRTSFDEDRLDPDSDPAHLQTTLNSLLSHDELSEQKKKRRMFHDGWREGPITFLPTYKYDVGRVGVFDSGEKKRAPSWCDRILYRTRKDKLDYENMLLEEEEAKRKDADLEASGIDKAADDENNMLYDYDPEADGEDDFQDARTDFTGEAPKAVVTREGFNDIIQLEYYVSHQRVLSSDHKPLDAVFRLQYDAADPELKAKIHSQVARDLDRVENEGRPVVTVVLDSPPGSDENDPDAVNFGDMHYEEDNTRSLTIANTGRASAFFGFLNQPEGKYPTKSPTPPWMTVDVEISTPDDPGGAKKVEKGKTGFEWAQDIGDVYSIEPGSACIVRMTAAVHTKELATSFNEGAKLDDILIFRVKDGRDHFMPVRGAWCQTSFCRSITDLVKIPEGGIRNVQAEQLAKQPTEQDPRNSLEDGTVRWSAPRELFLLTETIENLVERIVAEWSMLGPESESQQASPWEKFAGWPFVEESWTLDRAGRLPLRLAINEALDTSEPLDKSLDHEIPQLHRLEAFSETLLLFLDSLTDGIITVDLWKTLEQRFFTKERAKSPRPFDEQRALVLEILSTSSHHSVSFVLITSMLSRIVHELATHFHEETSLGRGAAELPTSPRIPVSKKLLDPDRNVARKQLMRKNMAAVFAKAMVRSPEPTSSKARYAALDQKQELVEIFLDNDPR